MRDIVLRKRIALRTMISLLLGSLAIAIILLSPLEGLTALPSQRVFSSPEKAVAALITALKRNSEPDLLAIVGPDGKDIVASGNEAADRRAREHFLVRYNDAHRLARTAKTRAVLLAGEDNWSFPVPIVKGKKGWAFDARAGREEILNRRIGRNEITVMAVMKGYVDAQNEYFRRDWDQDGLYEYAQSIVSKAGARDGLYWDVETGEERSPLGPLIAGAAREGYGLAGAKEGSAPYHGYFFRTLNGQGKAAPGGAYDYTAKGHMIFGFGLLAYPARYGVSGMKTFIVSHHGAIYEKDLGKNTEVAVKTIARFDPGAGWSKSALE
jgi:hypothetical protein